MLFLYRLGIWIYGQLISIAALFKPKAQLWKTGRQHLFVELAKAFPRDSKKCIWVHCASLGEFEQGRPIIEQLRQKYPAHKILLTFFSPSGYEIQKNCKLVDAVFYLPLDTKKNAKQFLDIINPQLAIFVKYEFWHFFLIELKTRKIPTVLVSAIFRKDQIFFKPYGSLFRKMLASFSMIFVQNENSIQLLKSIDIFNVQLAGDNRIDRVLQIAQSNKTIPQIELFKNNKNLFILGSTWPADESIFKTLIHDKKYLNWKFIIAPHDISLSRIESICKNMSVDFEILSTFNSEKALAAKVLIIDSIGLLSIAYQYGKIAYIGGGFGSGIHNTLEPAAHGLPVLFGPNHKKFEEARILIANQGGFVIQNKSELKQIFEKLLMEDFRKKASDAAYKFIQKNKGATEKTISFLTTMVNN